MPALSSFPFTSSIATAQYSTLSWALISLCIAYYLAIVVHRLFFHPLSSVPGPKLAAATKWVETYYECFYGDGGQFMWIYRSWHDKYGPIVRIGPNEVHIADPSYYETLFAQSRHSDKLTSLEHRFNNPMSAFATAEHSVHRHRRAAMNPFFSKRKIAQHAPFIQRHMQKLCARLRNEFQGTGQILVMNNMWGSFTSDIVVGYCLERPYNFILRPNFRAEFSDAMVDLLDPVHFITQFPWILTFLNCLPQWLVVKMSPPMASVYSFNDEMEDQIRLILKERATTTTATEKQTGSGSMFSAILESGLPPEELSVVRLQHEAISVIGAGIETTMRALSVASFFINDNKEIIARLRAELVNAIPNPAEMPILDSLMQLPYLCACIDEALRFTYGTSQRTPRLCPTAITYQQYNIPKGVVVSMDGYSVSHDEAIFPDNQSFRPERWLNNPRAPDGKPLSHYMVAFGRGTRSCVGMQLAYADLFIGLATLFRQFEFELYETKRDSVDCWMDTFVPRPRPGTLGVRATIK